MRKRSLLLLIIAAVMAVVLSACSSDANETSSSNNATPAKTSGQPAAANKAEDTKQPEPAEIIFYSMNNDPEESFDYRFGNSLREKFPHYTIEYMRTGEGRRIGDLIATGTPFDIYFHTIGNYEAYAFPHGIDYDMTQLIKQFDVDLNRFEPTVIQAIQNAYDGGMFALPVFTSNFVMYYNKDIFDRFGEQYLRDGMTWDEMVEVAKRLTRNVDGQQYFGYTHSPAHTLRLDPMSIPKADANGMPTIATDPRWRTFYDTYFFRPTDVDGYREYLRDVGVPNINDFVKEQNVAIYMYQSSLIYVWEEEMKNVNFDWAAVPVTEEGYGTQSYPAYFGITKLARNKEAAMEVLSYMVSDEFQMELSRKAIMPVVQTEEVLAAFGADSPYSDKNLAAAYYNKFAPIPVMSPYDASLVNIYNAKMLSALRGEKDINTALREAEEEAILMIEEFKKNNE